MAGGVVLIFGPDTGLVSERATRLVAKASEGDSDPFNLIKIDASELSSDPTRLIDEVLTVPLFGGRRIVWVKDAVGQESQSRRGTGAESWTTGRRWSCWKRATSRKVPVFES